MSFVRHHPLASVFILIALFRKGPQDLPASLFLLALMLALSFILGIAGFIIEYPFVQAVIRAMADITISLGLVYVILLLVGRKARVLQTLIALSGVGVILGSLSLPLLFLFEDAQGAVTAIAVLLYMIFMWNIAVTGHIFSQALSVSFPAGLLAALAYAFVAILIFYTLFPVQ